MTFFFWYDFYLKKVFNSFIDEKLSCSEFGELVTNRFHQFDEKLCQCDWYLFSLEMKQLYLIFMQNTQQPTLMCGFGNIVCTRDVFKKVNQFFAYENHLTFWRILFLCFAISDHQFWIFVFYVATPNKRINEDALSFS